MTEAEALVERLRDATATRYVSPYYLAISLLRTGRETAGLKALERAEDEASPHLAYLGVEPIFAPIRERRGFRDLLERVGIFALGPGSAPKPSGSIAAAIRSWGGEIAADGSPASGNDPRPREVMA